MNRGSMLIPGITETFGHFGNYSGLTACMGNETYRDTGGINTMITCIEEPYCIGVIPVIFYRAAPG